MHRFTSKNGIDFIKHFEGFKPTKYICPGGYLTIGYGHKLLPNEYYEQISKDAAQALLIKDLHKTERAVLKYINVEINDRQFDALVSFTYNLGAASLQRSTLRQKLNYRLYRQAGDEFLRWIYISTSKVPGLIYRRNAERKMFLS